MPVSGTDSPPGKAGADAQAKLAEVGCPSSDDAVLARVLRRALTEPDDWGMLLYCDAAPGDKECTLDGHVTLLPGEAEVLHRIREPHEPPEPASVVWIDTQE